jgi:hypothetical protein
VFTVIETPVFSRKAGSLLSEDEREEFAAFISQNPTVGSVVRGSGGVRKIRWARAGGGKNDRATIPAHELNLIKEAIERE